MISDDVIAQLYAAAAGRLDWEKPFVAIARQLNLWGIQLIGVDKRSGGLIFSAEGGPVSPQAALDYFRFYHRINPRMAPTLAMPAGQWMHCHEFFDDRYVAGSAFYQDFLIPHGGRYLSGTKIWESESVLYLVGLMRGNGSFPMGPSDFPALEQFRFHMTEALKNLVHLRAALVELSVARRLLDQFDRPMFLIDENRRIHHTNASAAKFLESNAVFRGGDGVLECLHPVHQTRFLEGVDGLELSCDAVHVGRRTVVMGEHEGRPLWAFLNRMDPDQTMGVFGNKACALVVLHDLAREKAAPDPLVIAEYFDMTPAEARVAAHLSSGFSVKEIAQRGNVAVSTVRSHVRKAMEKTGVRRQAELVRELLTLPAGERTSGVRRPGAPSAPTPALPAGVPSRLAG